MNNNKVPQNETVEEPVPSRLEAPQNLYDQDSEDFPEDLYDKELEAKAANEAKEQALRVEVGFRKASLQKIKKKNTYQIIKCCCLF